MERIASFCVDHTKLDRGMLLYGVTITFPDGVTVSIKQGSSFSVSRFIDRYNSKIQEEKSCLL